MNLKSPKFLTLVVMGFFLIALLPIFLTKAYAKHTKNNQLSTINTAIDSHKQTISTLVDDSNLLGTLVIVKEGDILYTEGFGYANQIQHIANSDDILYPIASLQKRMTAVIIAQLIRENKLTYETTIESFYPNLENSNTITIRDLLNHTSGLVMPEVAPEEVLRTEEAQLANVFNTSIEHGSREAVYSNGNYSLLAGIISQIDGTTYAQSLNQRLIEPLDLKNTYLWDNLPTDKDRASEYFYTNETYYDQNNLVYSEELMSSLLGAGNVYATASDIAKFELSLSDDTVLTEDEYYNLFATSKDDLISRAGNISIDGSRGGYSSYIYGDIGNKNLIVFLANQSTNDSTDGLFDSIYQQLQLF